MLYFSSHKIICNVHESTRLFHLFVYFLNGFQYAPILRFIRRVLANPIGH
jgi:hypothetical protein